MAGGAAAPLVVSGNPFKQTIVQKGYCELRSSFLRAFPRFLIIPLNLPRPLVLQTSPTLSSPLCSSLGDLRKSFFPSSLFPNRS